MKLRIYTDGASRGNPGPAAIAFIILTVEGDYVLKTHAEYVGTKTNNQAEYEALLSALQCAIKFSSQVVCYSDSELLIQQLKGEYRVRSPNMKTLWQNLVRVKEGFQQISFHHVPRTNEYIEKVDQLVNQELDRTMRLRGKSISDVKPEKPTKQTTLT